MKVDLTGNNIDGKAQLKKLNWLGIPLLAIYGPAIPEPIKYDAYTPDMVREAISKAAGKAIAAAPSPVPAPVR